MSIFSDTFEIKQPCDLVELEEFDSDDFKLIRDPRIGPRYLGYRLLTRLGGEKVEDIGRYIKLSNNNNEIKKQKIRVYEGSTLDYARLRYRLGVAEGNQEILSGFYFPFELNGDLLNAISLNKGLYLVLLFYFCFLFSNLLIHFYFRPLHFGRKDYKHLFT